MLAQSTSHLEYSFSMTRQEVEWTALDKHVLVTQRILLQESSRNGWLGKGSPVHGRYWLRLWGTVNSLYWLTRLKRVRGKYDGTLLFCIMFDMAHSGLIFIILEFIVLHDYLVPWLLVSIVQNVLTSLIYQWSFDCKRSLVVGPL